MPEIHILVVDEEEQWRGILTDYFRNLGYYVEGVSSVSGAQSSLLNRRFDVVFVNLHLIPRLPGLRSYPGRDYLGVQVIRSVHQLAPGTPSFIISGEPSELNERLRDYPEYVDFFLKRGLNLDDLARRVTGLETYRQRVANGYQLLQSELIREAGPAGSITAKIAADPIPGINELMDALAGAPKFRERVPALGVRLNKLVELERERRLLGRLSDTQEHDRREAIYFAIVVCQELQQEESL